MAEVRDIASPDDVRLLIERFYTSVRPDAEIGHFFKELDWDHHIPHITAFWNMLLFGENGFHGDPVTVHKRLHARLPMEHRHFMRWLDLFSATVDAHFAGAKAEEAKQRAQAIASMLHHKVVGGR